MNETYMAGLKKALKILVIIAGIALAAFTSYKLLFFFTPFIVAFAVSTIMEPAVRLLVLKLKIPRKIAAALTLFFVLLTFGVILVLIILKLIDEIKSISTVLPQYFSELYTNVNAFISKNADVYFNLPQEITKNLEGMITNISTSLMNILNSILQGILNTAISIPEAIIFILVTIISTYFMSGDREKIHIFFKTQLPATWIDRMRSIKDDMFAALLGYIRAQLILMTITFTELSIGFSIIGIRYAFLTAFIISLVDALPLLGTGGILIPWSVYSFLTGNIRLGVSLLILYVIVLVVRQLIEPKVLSQQIGVHPLLTLIAMYTGLKLIGFLGLILGPISVLLLKNILSGIFKNKSFKEVFLQNKSPR